MANGTATQDAPETFSNVTPVQETFSNVTPVAGTSSPFSLPHSWAEAKAKLSNMFSPSGAGVALAPTPGSEEEAIREGSIPAVGAMTTMGLAGAPIEAIATKSLAPLYPIVRAYLGAKAGGYVGKDIGEWLSDEHNKAAGGATGKQWGEYAGALIGGVGGNIPNPKEILLKKALSAYLGEGGAAAATEGATAGEAAAVGPKAPDIAGGPASFRKPSTSSQVTNIVNQATGTTPLEPKVPLREQIPAAKPTEAPNVPAQEPAPTTPNYAYRVRSQGEEGLPISQGNKGAHATTTLEDAQRLSEGRGALPENEGIPQEIVKFDLNKLGDQDYTRIPREGGPDWLRLSRPLKESELEMVRPQGEAPAQSPKMETPASSSGVQRVSGSDVVQHIADTSPIHNQSDAQQLIGDVSKGQYDLKSVPTDKLNLSNKVDPKIIQQYSQQDTSIPAIVLDNEGRVVDGNHRLAAAKLRGNQTIQAYTPVNSSTGVSKDFSSQPVSKSSPKEINDLYNALKPAEADPLKLKYPDPAQRQMVRANGERIVQAVGGDADTMKQVHDLTRVDLRQALINSGEDMGQRTVSNSKFAGEGSITREDAFNRLLAKGHSPSEIVRLAKGSPQATGTSGTE